MTTYSIYKKTFVARDFSSEDRFELWNVDFAPPANRGWTCVANSYDYEAMRAALRLMKT